jgi:GAF domain-containing protein
VNWLTIYLTSLAVLIVSVTAVFIYSRRMQKEREQQARRNRLLLEIAQLTNASLNPEQILDTTVQQMVSLFDVDHSGIVHFDTEHKIANVVAECPDSGALERKIQLDNPINKRLITKQEPVVIEDTWQDPLAESLQDTIKELQIRSMLLVPLVVREEVVGSIGIDAIGRHRHFSDEEIDFAQTIANQVAMAMENARLYEETQRRALQLEAAAEVARSATAILDVDELLNETVHLISDQFGFYHAGVFLVDEPRDYAILHAASSEGGQRMLEQGHRLAIGEVGIVGYVTATGTPRIALDVGEDAVHFANPYLPETHSEMALPLISRGEVIGALDVQSVRQAAFTEEDVSLLQTMADQLANAIKNAQLFETTRRRVAELEAARQASLHLTSTLKLQPTLDAILKHTIQVISADDAHIFLYDGEQLEFGAARWAGEIQKQPYAKPRPQGLTYTVARSGKRMIVPDVQQHQFFQDGLWEDWHGAIIGLPLKVSGQVRGVMNISFDAPHSFNQEEVRALELLADQAAVAIENARLFEETKRRLDESRLLQQVMQAAASTLDFDKVLTRTIKTLHSTLNIDYLSFAQPDDRQTAMVIHPSTIGYPPPEESTWRLPMDESVLGHVYRTGEPLLLRDVRETSYYFEVADDVRSEMAMPVWVGNEVIGVLNAEARTLNAFDEEDQHLFSAIAAQLGMVLENAQLYQRLQKRQEELSQTYEKLKELDRLRAEMVQNVNHEIRTPFSLIQGYLELLLDEDLGPLQREQQDALITIRERTAKLASIIQNLAMLEEAPREQPQLSPIPLIDVLQHTLVKFRHLARQTGLQMKEDLPSGLPLIQGDREQLHMVFGHLLENAIKFSPEGGTITVHAWAEKDWNYVSVSDEGIGIAPEHLDRIFERFYQVDGSTTRRFGGMGLGLALVWEIIEAHNGIIEVDSEPNEGSTFTVKLPQANSIAPPA